MYLVLFSYIHIYKLFCTFLLHKEIVTLLSDGLIRESVNRSFPDQSIMEWMSALWHSCLYNFSLYLAMEIKTESARPHVTVVTSVYTSAANQMPLINWSGRWGCLYESQSFRCFLAWSIQWCVNKMPRRQDISSDQRKAIVAAHQSEKSHEVISSKMYSISSTIRKIIHKCKTFRTVSSLLRTGCPSTFTPRSDHAMLLKIAKYPRVTSQILQALVSMLNIKVHDSTIIKDWSVARKKPLL